MNKYILILIILLINNINSTSQNVGRKDLLTSSVSKQVVSKIETKEIFMPARAKASYHSHPCPVVGYIVSGTVIFQIEGEDEQILTAGSAFFEPKDTPILKFDNASETESLVFVAHYIVADTENLIEILEPKEN